MRAYFVGLMLLFSVPVWAHCTLNQKADLAKAGYAKEEIEKMCSGSEPVPLSATIQKPSQDQVKATENATADSPVKDISRVRVYFINPEGGFNDALIMRGDKVLARTNRGMYHFTDVTPGRHTFHVTTWSKILKSSIEIDTSSGQDVYLLVKANTGAGVIGILAGPFVANATSGGPYLFESTTTENGKQLLSSNMEFVEEKQE